MPVRRVIETIGPKKAKSYLDMRDEGISRPITQNLVAKYARDLEEKRWYYTGEGAIVFSKDDILLNGSHRLNAVLVSGVSMKVDVVRGIDKDAFVAMDIGKSRTAADVFGIHGYTNPWVISSAVSWTWRYYSGNCIRKLAPTNPEAIDFATQHPRLKESIELILALGTGTMATKGILPIGMTAALHYMFSMKDEKAADEFLERVINGSALRDGSPYYKLRERLLLARTERKHRLSPTVKMAYAIKAWNWVREGRATGKRQLRWTNRGNAAESFPEIV